MEIVEEDFRYELRPADGTAHAEMTGDDERNDGCINRPEKAPTHCLDKAARFPFMSEPFRKPREILVLGGNVEPQALMEVIPDDFRNQLDAAYRERRGKAAGKNEGEQDGIRHRKRAPRNTLRDTAPLRIHHRKHSKHMTDEVYDV